MQTFLPYPDFARSASVLDRSRLGKQRVETLQILQVLASARLITSDKVPIYADGLPTGKTVTVARPQSEWVAEPYEPKGWANHPAVNMWRGHANALAWYGIEICREWVSRGYKDTCLEKINHLGLTGNFEVLGDYMCPDWLGAEEVHASHRSNLLRKDADWYGQFGWTEPDDLEYVWPV